MFTLLSADVILLPSYMNWFTNFSGLVFHVEMILSWLHHINSVYIYIYIYKMFRGVSDVMLTVVGNGYSDPSSNPGQGCLYFT